MIKLRKHTIPFICFDYLAAMLAWSTFFTYRKVIIEPAKFGYTIPIELDINYYVGLFLIPLAWVVLYLLAGNYADVWKKSRIKEISRVFTTSIIGVLILFFSLLLDDEVKSYESYYKTFVTLFILHFSITVVARIAMATYIKLLINKKIIGFNTIIIGSDSVAYNLANELLHGQTQQGYKLQGYVTVNSADEMQHILPNLGVYTDLPQKIKELKTEEIIIALNSSKHKEITDITNLIESEPIQIKIVPDLYDVVSGGVKIQNVLGTALIELNPQMVPTWQLFLKRLFDIIISAMVLIALLPLYVILAIAVKSTSKGNVFFKQTRIGLHGKPFTIIKYRTMVEDAEKNGPALSSKNDNRITPLGKILRKYRLDEIPQFYNVFVGDMSLVGPRPERQFYIDQLMRVAPHYKHIQRVKPGITSWGMVKYGYAENIEQMIERMKFDILYIENMSLAMDLRILIYTVKTIIQGRGK